MSKIESIEEQIQGLSTTELAAFRRWFHEFDARIWDQQIEEDIKAGRLDDLANEALRDFDSGRCKEI